MHPRDLLTPAELRLAGFLFFVSLLGAACPAPGPGPEVIDWLDGLSAVSSLPDSGRDGPAASPPPTLAPAPDGSLSAGDSTSAPAEATPVTPGINPNRASHAELLRLPGVGPVLAERILIDRQQHGPYRRPEDLLRVKGIGPATLARMRDHLAWP